jgi:hypothetical protein
MTNVTLRNLAKNVWDLADLTGDENIMRQVQDLMLSKNDNSDKAWLLVLLFSYLVDQVNDMID